MSSKTDHNRANVPRSQKELPVATLRAKRPSSVKEHSEKVKGAQE